MEHLDTFEHVSPLPLLSDKDIWWMRMMIADVLRLVY